VGDSQVIKAILNVGGLFTTQFRVPEDEMILTTRFIAA
jgi:hypothetical protein